MIANKDAIPSILGSQGIHRGPSTSCRCCSNSMLKHASLLVWDGRRTGTLPGQNYGSLIDVRDKTIHTTRRKPWNQAFSGAAVKDYQVILERTGEELSTLLRKAATTTPSGETATVDIARWVSYFAYVLCDMIFGDTCSDLGLIDLTSWERWHLVGLST